MDNNLWLQTNIKFKEKNHRPWGKQKLGKSKGHLKEIYPINYLMNCWKVRLKKILDKETGKV